MLLRLVMLALLIAVMWPIAYFWKGFVYSLSDQWVMFGSGGVVGFAMCYALWRWEERIRQRAGRN